MTEMHTSLQTLAQFAAEKYIRGRSYNRSSILNPFVQMLEGLERFPGTEDREYLCAKLKDDISEHIRRASRYGLGPERRQAIYTYVDCFFSDILDKEHHGNPAALLDRERLLKPAYLLFFREAVLPSQRQKADDEEESDPDDEQPSSR